MGTIKTTFSNNIDDTGKLKEGSLGFSAGTSWQAIKTSDFTAVAGEGYFVDTTSGAITVTLPSSPSAGDYVVLKDYARTWATNNVTTSSALFDGVASQTPSFSTNGQTITIVYMDGTKGWSLVNEDTTTGLGAQFVTATGGTILTSGDYKTHVFTGDGCFVVSSVGNPAGSTSVEYLVVAGGGSGGRYTAGGGGAGGYRQNYPSPTTAGLSVTAQTYPITVGGGGASVGPAGAIGCGTANGNRGSNSVFSTITSTGGGGGGGCFPGVGPTFPTNGPGGSGGGAGRSGPAGGTGNTPPTSPSQGNNGGTTSGTPSDSAGGGGGGAGAVGTDGTSGSPGPGSSRSGGAGGIGLPIATAFFGPTSPSYGTPGPAPGRYFAGGGAAGTYDANPGTTIPGGSGGGGPAFGTDTSGAPGALAGTAGTTNTGGGGGSCATSSGQSNSPGAGGSGIVAIRYKYQ